MAIVNVNYSWLSLRMWDLLSFNQDPESFEPNLDPTVCILSPILVFERSKKTNGSKSHKKDCWLCLGLTPSLTNGTRAATRAGSLDGWRSQHITTLLIRFRFHVKNSSVLLRLTDPNRPGGGHPVWSTCSPSSLSRTWAPWSSRPSAGLSLGPPGREMVNGGGRLIKWKWQQQKLWWFMVMDDERLWKMYKRRARSREPGTLGSTQVPASPPPRKALAIGIATTLGR